MCMLLHQHKFTHSCFIRRYIVGGASLIYEISYFFSSFATLMKSSFKSDCLLQSNKIWEFNSTALVPEQETFKVLSHFHGNSFAWVGNSSGETGALLMHACAIFTSAAPKEMTEFNFTADMSRLWSSRDNFDSDTWCRIRFGVFHAQFLQICHREKQTNAAEGAAQNPLFISP